MQTKEKQGATNVSKHTPGPWRVGEKREKEHIRIEQCSAIGDGQWAITVAWMNDDANTVPDADGRLGETWRANAQLIAAAPDLLASLRSMIEIFICDRPGLNDVVQCWDAARAAIAKAERDAA